MVVKRIDVNGWRVNCLIVACLTVFLTVSDAFETNDLGLAHQVLLWAVVSMLLVVQVVAAERLFDRLLPKLKFRPGLVVALTLSLTVVLMTLELHWLKFTPLLPKAPDPLLEFFVFLAPPVGALASLVLLARSLSQPDPSLPEIATEADVAESSGDTTNPSLEEVTDLNWIAQNYTVKHLQADDHYLAINCIERSFFTRARMKDAVQSLQSVDGLQVHRSHWVARDYIQRLYREGRDFKLLLKNGSVVPVARSRAGAVRKVL